MYFFIISSYLESLNRALEQLFLTLRDFADFCHKQFVNRETVPSLISQLLGNFKVGHPTIWEIATFPEKKRTFSFPNQQNAETVPFFSDVISFSISSSLCFLTFEMFVPKACPRPILYFPLPQNYASEFSLARNFDAANNG